MSLLGRTLLSGGFLVGFEYNGCCEIVGLCAMRVQPIRFALFRFAFLLPLLRCQLLTLQPDRVRIAKGSVIGDSRPGAGAETHENHQPCD